MSGLFIATIEVQEETQTELLGLTQNAHLRLSDIGIE